MKESERAILRKDLQTVKTVEVRSGGTQAGKTTQANASGKFYTGFENGARVIWNEHEIGFTK